MSSYGGLKHTFLDGPREYTSMENTRGPFQCTGLHDRRNTSVSSFREWPPRCPRSTDAALCRWCRNDDSADTEHEPSQFSYCCMGLVEEMRPTDQSYQRQLPHHWAKKLFRPNGSGAPIPISKFVKDLGVQTDNKWSHPLLSALKPQIRQDDWSSR